MEVSIVLERNNATKESFTVNSNKPLGLDANNSFITIEPQTDFYVPIEECNNFESISGAIG